MTERLYYLDAETLEFDARVMEIADTSGQPGVILDRTAFYPTSGGQPFDTGRLGEAQVLEVVDEGERIVHVLSAPLAPGAVVHGVVDAPRRRDHMQQHTGQHILSAAFERLFANPTVSFHLGGETCTIDLARPLPPEDIERAVDEANRVVWEDRQVVVRFAGADEARAAGLRKQSQREGELRLVEVTGFDLSACGGTHVATTGAVGLIAVIATEKFKGGLRVSFVCGRRALNELRLLRDAVAGSLRVLSVPPAELPDAIRRLQAEGKTLRKRAADLQLSLAGQEADRLSSRAPGNSPVTIVAEVMDGWEIGALRAIVSNLIARGPMQVVLATTESPVSVVVGQSSPTGVAATELVARLTSRFGGRGGGTRELAQAGGLDGAPEAVVGAAREEWTKAQEPGTKDQPTACG